MNREKGRTRQRVKEASHADESQKEGSSREMITVGENIVTKQAHPSDDICSTNCTSSKDMQLFSKPSLSYIALIAKVILSAPFQKLKLSSIYRAMEEQFPYLRSRGPGWRNSVRHNLSVNDCFVKVSRCEDGRGHYWGVHQAHLKDFQQGNFRQYRKARGRRERERYDRMVGCLAWMESRPGPVGWVDPLCPLQEPRRYQMSSVDWTEAQQQPWRFNMDWKQSSDWMRRCCFPDFCNRAVARRGHGSQTLTCRLHGWDTDDPRGMTESYDSRFMTSPLQHSPFSLPGCWCMSPVVTQLIKPMPYKVNYLYHP